MFVAGMKELGMRLDCFRCVRQPADNIPADKKIEGDLGIGRVVDDFSRDFGFPSIADGAE